MENRLKFQENLFQEMLEKEKRRKEGGVERIDELTGEIEERLRQDDDVTVAKKLKREQGCLEAEKLIFARKTAESRIQSGQLVKQGVELDQERRIFQDEIGAQHGLQRTISQEFTNPSHQRATSAATQKIMWSNDKDWRESMKRCLRRGKPI